jgi:hypothetical protein
MKFLCGPCRLAHGPVRLWFWPCRLLFRACGVFVRALPVSLRASLRPDVVRALNVRACQVIVRALSDVFRAYGVRCSGPCRSTYGSLGVSASRCLGVSAFFGPVGFSSEPCRGRREPLGVSTFVSGLLSFRQGLVVKTC